MRRLPGLVLLLAAVAALLAFREASAPPPGGPAELAAAAWSGTAPAAWVRLTGGRLDVLEGAFVRSKAGEITELLVPLRPEDQPPEGPVRVVVRVRRDDPLFGLLRQGEALGSEAEAGRFLEQSRQALVPRRPVEGLVVPAGERDLVKLQGMKGKLAPGWVLLEEGAAPRRGPSPALLGLAGVLLAAGLALGLRRLRLSDSPPPAG